MTISGLRGRTALITGASRGIGFAVAKSFAQHGAKEIILLGRNSDSLKKAAERIKESYEPSDDQDSGSAGCVQSHVGDVKDRNFWITLAQEVRDIDILVNAAGITHSSLLVATHPWLVDDVLRTNLYGAIWGCQIMSKQMMRQRKRSRDSSACIINIASLLGVKGGYGSTIYAASKAGVLGLTRSLAGEFGPANIRVNAIVPGYIETDMTEGMTPEARSKALNAIPQKRFGSAEEIANAAIFLANNGYANNCILNLDGGLSAM